MTREKEELAGLLQKMLKVVEEAKEKTPKAIRTPRQRRRTGAADGAPKKLTANETEMLLNMARASLEAYGTLVPPREVMEMVGRATCPHCEEEKDIATDFGFKKLANGQLRRQSWCRTCRNSPDSHPSRFSR